jgi:hypothetical protein
MTVVETLKLETVILLFQYFSAIKCGLFGNFVNHKLFYGIIRVRWWCRDESSGCIDDVVGLDQKEPSGSIMSIRFLMYYSTTVQLLYFELLNVVRQQVGN